MRLALLVFVAITASGETLIRESLIGTHVREVRTPECVVFEDPLRPFAYEYDGAGRLIRRTPLFFNSGQPALVFDPNPVAAINDPSLRDDNDSPAAVPGHAYSNATVDLLGPNVRIVEQRPPATAQPDPNAPLMFDRGDDRFEPVNAVFHIDRTQRHLQELGYRGARQLVPYAIEVDALASTGADTSFFIPSFTDPGRGSLHYGIAGTDDAEDGDLVVHEYGHAILEWIAPGTFGGSFFSESRAFSEAFCDYLAFSAHYEQRIESGRDPFCFADWDARCWTDAPAEGCGYPAGSDCLRRLDGTRTMADYERLDSSGVEHRNAQILSPALREIFLKLGRTTTDVILIESLFGAPPQPTFAIMARRMIEVDRLLFGGAHRDTICAAMTARGIAVSCDGTPRGELTVVQSPDRSILIPDRDPNGIVSRIVVTDPRSIERIGVRVDIEHPLRGDLRIELVAPDGTKVLLTNISFDRTPDIHATFGIDAQSVQSLDVLRGRPAAGTWELRVADLSLLDVGSLQSWGLVIQFAGDEPLTTRPRSAKTQMIPVVTHLYGEGVTPWASDVRVANITGEPRTATLVFTRSGDDGTTSFSAVDVFLEAGATASFNDVVSTLFQTTGSGSLEVLGDVLVTSRTYTTLANGGQLGQEVPATTGGDKLYVAGLARTFTRYNLGITETSGNRTRVVMTTTSESRELILEPFSHVQIAGISSAHLVAEGGRIAAYVSQIDRFEGSDPLFVPAQQWPRETAIEIAPAIYASGVNLTVWRTDLWVADPDSTEPFKARYRGFEVTRDPGVYIDAVRETFGYPGTSGPLLVESSSFAATRIFNGRSSQFVPLRALDDRGEQHLIGIDNDATHRANIGIVSDGSAAAEVLVYDAGGTLVDSFILFAPGGLAQSGVTATVTGGRALVRHVAGGRIRAYASVIDNRSGDAAFIDGQ